MTISKWHKSAWAMMLGLSASVCLAGATTASLPVDKGTVTAAAPSTAMLGLDDSELEQVSGQSLFNISYLAPGDAGNTDPTNANVGFYKLGVEGQLDINANIRKLQLGCGGANGAGGCDIDIDNFSLSGDQATSAARVASDASMINPFLEFAIKNPNDPATRQIVGYRISTEKLTGMLTMGDNQNADGSQNYNPNGLNSFSGYMSLAATSGSTYTAPGSFTEILHGRANIGGCISGCPVPYTTDNQAIPVPTVQPTFNVAAFSVTGQRLSQVAITASTIVPDIPLVGTRSATMDSCFVVLIIPLCGYSIQTLNISGTLHGLPANITINESLGNLHKIPLANPFALSLQSMPIMWPGYTVAAQQGWWMNVADPVQLGSLSTPTSYQVDISSAYPQVATKVSTYLTNNPVSISFGDAVGSLFTSALNVNVGTIDLSTAGAVSVTLASVPLGTAQNAPPNCWGSTRFC